MKEFICGQIGLIKRGGTKTLLFKLTKILLLPIALLFAFVMRIIRPFIHIRFGELVGTRIGHFALNMELYFCKLDAGIRNNKYNNKYIDIFFCGNCTCNDQLKKMWVRTFKKYRKHKVFLLRPPKIFPIGFANTIIPGGEKFCISTTDRDVDCMFDRFPPHIAFTAEENERGRRELCDLGIPEGCPFICSHVRDSAYLDKNFNQSNWSYHNFRDSDIFNTLPAAEELKRRGYYVIRMGALVKEVLNSKNPMVIDYATNRRTDFLDVYLSAKCNFFLGTASGATSGLPVIFRRPIVWANFIPLEYVPGWSSRDLFIPKKLWLRKEDRYMCFREILESGVGRFLTTRQYEDLDIEVVENTPEEILAVAVEMDERLRGTWTSNKEDEELQQQFWSLFKPSDLNQVFYVRIGTGFLRQNAALLK